MSRSKRFTDDELKARKRAADAIYRAKNRDKAAAWRSENRGKVAEYQAAYRANNKDKQREYMKEWVAANTRKVKSYNAVYRVAYENKNRERIAARKSAALKASGYYASYRAKNRDRIRAANNNYRARRCAAAGRLSGDIVGRLMDLQKGKCVNCRANLRAVGRHLDHITPLALGGSNDDGNVQLLCPRCNVKKKATDPITWAQRNGRLL